MLALPHRRVVRLLLALVTAGLLLTLAQPQPAHAASEGKLVLVLDSSGSMRGRIEGGTKIAVAKKALNTVVDHLPNDAQVGLRVYGSRIESAKDPRACTDSELVVPIGTGNKSALKDQIARYKPLGETPISYSLKQAAKDLGSSGRRSIVLVSDGEETCGVDPCVTAANLAKQGIDLKIDVVGLAVSGKTRSQLQCIADKGHGTYYDARNRKQIEDSLDKLSTRAFRPFQLTGTPLEGSEDPATAPEAPPGQYVDQLPGRQMRKLWYRVPRSALGSTIHVGITAKAVSSTSAATVEIDDPKGGRCGSGLGLSYLGLTSGGGSSWRSDPKDPCNTADHLLVGVYAPVADLTGARFELLVFEEPPLASDRHLPPAGTTAWEGMPSGSATKGPVPGLSLSDAPVLTPGRYTETVLTGETQVFAVDLAWGQRLQTELVVAPRHGALARELDVSDTFRTQLLGAGRDGYDGLRVRGMPDDDISMSVDAKTYRQYESTSDIRYLNRSAGSAAAAAGAVPGRQYIVVSKNRSTHKQAFLVPYELRLAVFGTAGDGAPEYASSSTPTPSPTPPANGPTPSSTPAVTSPATPPTSPVTVSLGTVVGVAVGALALGGLGTAAALAVRRRRSAGKPQP